MQQDSSTQAGHVIAEQFHYLAEYSLDIEGAAQAFRFIHGDEIDPESPPAWHSAPTFAYDPIASTWRKWEYGKGWSPQRSVLGDMTTIMGALCAVTTNMANPEPTKAETEYRKARQRSLGSNVSRAVTLAQDYLTVEDWDSDPNLLGLPNGESLYITPTNPQIAVHQFDQQATDYLTQSLAAVPTRPTALWTEFVSDLCGGDDSMAHGLQVWTAAAMIDGNPHHRAHILFGDGNTGKSTYLKTIQAAMGDYAGSARASVFVSEKDNHPAELLPFVDKRLVVLPELPRGALRSDLLKTVTGGDAISVRGMRENPRTQTPSATLMFSANELPSIRLVDNAIKRRLMIWPFDHQPERVDVGLGAKLVEPKNLSGVVGWLRDGLRDYIQLTAQGQDMPMPDAVRKTTDQYFTEADTIGQWRDSCIQDGGETLSANLYRSFVGWCEPQKRKPLSERSFTLWLGRHYDRRRTRSGSTYPVTINRN